MMESSHKCVSKCGCCSEDKQLSVHEMWWEVPLARSAQSDWQKIDDIEMKQGKKHVVEGQQKISETINSFSMCFCI